MRQDRIFNPDARVFVTLLCCALGVDVYQLLIFGVWEGENVTVVCVVIVWRSQPLKLRGDIR